VLESNVVLAHKSVLGPYPRRIVRTTPRFSSPRCSPAIDNNSSHSSLLVFRHLRTLSFLGSQLSSVFPIGCALFGKKRGVHPLVLQLSPPFPGTPFSRMATLPACLPFTGRPPRLVIPFPMALSLRGPLQGIAEASPLTPFTTSLRQKQGGRGYWSYQLSSRLDALPSLRSVLCVLCVSAVSLLLFPFVPPRRRLAPLPPSRYSGNTCFP
jgi:hypothetical protein